MVEIDMAYSTLFTCAAILLITNIQPSVTLHADASSGRLSNIKPLCGYRKFNSTLEICCGLHTRDRYDANGFEMSCCLKDGDNAETYSKTKKLCCGYQLVSFERLAQQNFTNPICLNNEIVNVEKGLQICERADGTRQIFNSSTQICCRGEVSYNRITNSLCCCDKPYDEMTHECNRDCTITALNFKEYCRGKPYDPEDEVCCEDSGKILSKPKRRHTYSAPIHYVCKNEALARSGDTVPKCGGVSVYHASSAQFQFFCCNDVPHYVQLGRDISCCGNDTVDNDSGQKCCDGVILRPEQDCCNNIAIDTQRKACCGREIIDKDSHVCCKRSSSTFSSMLKQSKNHTDCCKNQSYNKYDQMCTQGKLEDIPEPAASPAPGAPAARQPPTKAQPIVKPSTCIICRELTQRDIDNICKRRNDVHIFSSDVSAAGNFTIVNGVSLNRDDNLAKMLSFKIPFTGCEQCIEEKGFYHIYRRRRSVKPRGTNRISKRDYIVKAQTLLCKGRSGGKVKRKSRKMDYNLL